MKKLICFFLALVMMTSLWACTNAPENQDDSLESPSSSEPSTEPSTELENPTEPEETAGEEKTLLDELSEQYDTALSYIRANMYCPEDVASNGRVTLTSLETGEVVENINGYYFDITFYDDDCLDWRKAVASADGLFEDATDVVRVESRAKEDWYMEFHNGSDAKYIYFSELDLYVPFFGRFDPTEQVNDGIDALKEAYFMMDPDFRMEDSSPEKIAEAYCDRALELWQIRGEETERYTDVSIGNITYELRDDGKKIAIFYDMTATPINDYPIFAGHTWENEDGSWTCAMEAYLTLGEDGKWLDPDDLQFYLPEE